MVWQDYIVMSILIIFSYALIPQIIQGFKEKKGLVNIQTSSITSIGMLILTIIYATLNLTFSAIVSEITGALWAIIFFQKVIYK